MSTQAFLLVGMLFLLPIILMYTGWSYWVFRGKVRAGLGYHLQGGSAAGAKASCPLFPNQRRGPVSRRRFGGGSLDSAAVG